MQAENKNYIVAIDLGSGSVTAAAGSKDPDGRLNIIDMVSKPMQGMSCGEVINIEQVTGAVRAAVGELEEHLGIKVTEAYAGISGHDIKCADSSYFVYVSGEDHEICEEDVAKLHESMNSLQPPEGICILDRTPQKYVIDSREETMQPVGRFGQQLEATFNFILANRGSLERLNKAFLRLGIVQRRLFTNAQASAAAILTEDEKELGAAVIDIGAGCTDICIWQDNIMRYVGVLPVGSDAINRDIRSIAIPERFIEKLKTTHGYAVAAQIPEEKRSQNIKIKGRTQRENKEISFYNLAQIIEARLLDIVENVMEEIKESGYADKLGSGIVLTGGGAYLKDIDTLFRERTKYDVRTGSAYPELVNDRSLPAADDMHLSSGDVVEHQGEKGLIGVPMGLEKRRDHAPKAACGHARDGAQGVQRPGGKVSAVDHHGGGGHGPHQHLPFGADVPEAHPEGGQHRKADAQKNGRIPQGDPGAPGSAYRAAPDPGVYAQGIHARHAHNDERADHQRQQNGNQTDQRRTDEGHALPLDDMKQGFFGGYLTHASASLFAPR